MSRAAAAVLTLLAAGCAVGPSYHPEEVVPASTRVGAAASSESTRSFFDSLAAARQNDTLAAPGAALAPRALLPDSLAGLEWIDIFHDSTMVGLVRTALRQNRDLQTAVEGSGSSAPRWASRAPRCSRVSPPTAA